MKKLYLNWALVFLGISILLFYGGFALGMSVDSLAPGDGYFGSHIGYYFHLFFGGGALFMMAPGLIPLVISGFLLKLYFSQKD
ncbi:MAG: hypothetical protein LBI43_03175 [Streptococcaceae bacterium]|jgi:hypothetical protein|nr:hypothetical protein [Streptococcaceae bacterium]